MEKMDENIGQELKPPRKKKYENRRKINTDELSKGSIVKYDLETSTGELKRMFDELLFKFSNHILLTRSEEKSTTTLQGMLRDLKRIRGKIN